MLNRSQWNFAQATTVLVSWHVQNLCCVVIGWICYEQEHYKFLFSFEFNRNIISGTGVSSLLKVLCNCDFDIKSCQSLMVSRHVIGLLHGVVFNKLRPAQNGRQYSNGIFKCIFLKENVCILIRYSLKCVSAFLVDNKSAMVQESAWHRTADKTLQPEYLNQRWQSSTTPNGVTRSLISPECRLYTSVSWVSLGR